MPDKVADPLLKIAPEIEDGNDEDVNIDPPIPTPPVTINAPVDEEVEAVEAPIEVLPK